jgi:hypothetical protein
VSTLSTTAPKLNPPQFNTVEQDQKAPSELDICLLFSTFLCGDENEWMVKKLPLHMLKRQKTEVTLVSGCKEDYKGICCSLCKVNINREDAEEEYDFVELFGTGVELITEISLQRGRSSASENQNRKKASETQVNISVAHAPALDSNDSDGSN